MRKGIELVSSWGLITGYKNLKKEESEELHESVILKKGVYKPWKQQTNISHLITIDSEKLASRLDKVVPEARSTLKEYKSIKGKDPYRF